MSDIGEEREIIEVEPLEVPAEPVPEKEPVPV